MSILAANPKIMYREIYPTRDQISQQSLTSGGGCLASQRIASGITRSITDRRNNKDTDNSNNGKVTKRDFRVFAFWPDLSRPTSVEMEPINDCEHLDQILLNAQQISQPIIIDWMAAWCRKCIYLKPKLEKMAAEYDTKLKIYCVDVNKVPQALVKRGNITKMPTIQLWKDGEMKAEVIGGHKAWLVIEEVKEMIQKFV